MLGVVEPHRRVAVMVWAREVRDQTFRVQSWDAEIRVVEEVKARAEILWL